MKTLYVIALIITCGISLAAQEKDLTEAEYTEAITKAEKSLYVGAHGPFRMSMENDVTTEGRPETDYRLRAVTLTVPGQGTHRTEDRSFGGKPTKAESITLNDRSFRRDADGPWKEMAVSPRAVAEPGKSPAADLQTLDRDASFKYIGTESFQGRNVRVYTRSERRKTQNPETGAITESESRAKVYIATDGTYFRNEMSTKNLFNGKTGRVKIVIEVQADPTIKLSIPDVTK